MCVAVRRWGGQSNELGFTGARIEWSRPGRMGRGQERRTIEESEMECETTVQENLLCVI